MKIIGDRPSGQMLLIATMIAVLLLLAIPTILFLTQTTASHQIGVQERTQTRAIAEAGISQMIEQLSSTDWTTIAPPTVFGGGCDGATWIDSPLGGQYKLECSSPGTDPTLMSYQVGITATARLSAAQTKSMSAVRALVSRKTAAVTLKTGETVDAAVLLTQKPNMNSNGLFVWFGPVVNLDMKPKSPPPTPVWQLQMPFDVWQAGSMGFIQGFPRIYSNGGLEGRKRDPLTGNFYYARVPATGAQLYSTDHKQYWAFASMSPPPKINIAAYAANAADTGIQTCPNLPTPSNGAVINVTRNGLGLTCSFTVTNIVGGAFDPTNDYALFGPGFTIVSQPVGGPAHPLYIYVNGPAAIANMPGIDLKDGGMVVEGNMVIRDNNTASTLDPVIHVPKLTRKDAPPAFPPEAWYCKNALDVPNATCDLMVASTAGGADRDNSLLFKGFLYVTQKLSIYLSPVTAFPPPYNCNMSGVLMVGDPEELPPPDYVPNGEFYNWSSSALQLFYDPVVSRNILTEGPPYPLMIDEMKEVTAR